MKQIQGVTLGQITNVKKSGDENSVYFADVEIDPHGGENLEVCFYCARSDDMAPTGQWVYEQIVAGNFEGEITQLAPGVDPQTGLPPPPPSAHQNEKEAQRRLSATDWVNQPDVYDPANTPHLTNRDDFIAYRSALRAIAINPTEGNLEWPVAPSATWSS